MNNKLDVRMYIKTITWETYQPPDEKHSENIQYKYNIGC